MSGDYVCNICGKQFLTKGGLSSHNCAVHNTVESPCTVCDTLKIHIIGTHLLDVLRETEKTLHGESDEPVELAHYRTLKFEERHGYLTSERKMKTKRAGEKQQDMMEHLNSYHLR